MNKPKQGYAGATPIARVEFKASTNSLVSLTLRPPQEVVRRYQGAFAATSVNSTWSHSAKKTRFHITCTERPSLTRNIKYTPNSNRFQKKVNKAEILDQNDTQKNWIPVGFAAK